MSIQPQPSTQQRAEHTLPSESSVARAPGAHRSRAALALAIATAVATLVATMTGSSIAAPSPPSNAQSEGCPRFELLLVPGTGETSSNDDPTNSDGMMLSGLASGLQHTLGNQIRIHTVAYAARAFTDGWLYEDSKQDGIARTNAELQRLADVCPRTSVGIAGYSQGADVAGDVACAVGNDTGPLPATSVVGVALVSDPHQGTDGATPIGNSSTSEGILGPRDCSYGALSDRVATFCQSGDNPDLYCAASKSSNPILSGIASVMGTSSASSTSTDSGDTSGNGGDAAAPASAGELAEKMVSDFSHADVAGLGTAIDTLVQQASTGDLAGAAITAGGLLDTLTPLADVIDTALDNPGFSETLATAAEGTPEAAAGHLIDLLTQVDLNAVISTVQQIADTALGMTGAGARAPSSETGAAPDLASTATSLASQMQPVTSAPADILASASQVLGVIKPKVIVDQIINVATGTLSTATNIPKILDAFHRLVAAVTAPDLDLWGKVDAVHAIADELNLLFQPLVKMAAGVDLHTVSRLIGLIPDPSGVAPIVSLVVNMLGNIDIIRVANRVGDIQDTAWKFLHSCETGCNPMIAGDLIPIALDFANIALGALTGASKTPSDQLGEPDAVTTQLNGPGASVDAAAGQLAGLTDPEQTESLSALVGEGLQAASFFASGTHTSYTDMVVDSSGRTTIDYLVDWFTGQLGLLHDRVTVSVSCR